MLLIVGDGIREGAEAIAGYLQDHAGLHFSLGLVEMPIFVPRVLARANIITRTVIEVPLGHALEDGAQPDGTGDADPDQTDYAKEVQQFWTEFLSGLKLDDPEQSIPRPARLGYLTFMLPAKNGSSWIGVFRNLARGEVGVQLSSSNNSPGDHARQVIVDDWEAIKDQIGGTAKPVQDNGRTLIRDIRMFGDLGSPAVRKEAFA